jgi:hypothetical protein
MTLPPTDAPFIGWDWDVVHDADMNDSLPPLYYNGEPIDLTGCTISLYVRPTYDYEDPIVLMFSPDNITIDDATNGLVTVYAPKSNVDNWPVGEWRFFLTVTDGDGNIAEVARGPFRVHAGNIAP